MTLLVATALADSLHMRMMINNEDEYLRIDGLS
jgi:hypothetical protein